MQYTVFTTQWALMLLGFYLLATILAPARIFDPALAYERYLDASLKALAALAMSTIWLFIWDRQVRIYFYRNQKGT